MSLLFFFFFFFFFNPKNLVLSLAILSLATATETTKFLAYGNAKPSVYEVLRDYDFPSGILPKGVAGYELDPSTGKFSAYMNQSCSFSVEGSYQLYYKPIIRGLLYKGRLENLEGVRVKLFWLWIDIVEVKRIGGDLEFSVGIAGAGFPVDNFEESPQCGCGLNCNVGMKKRFSST